MARTLTEIYEEVPGTEGEPGKDEPPTGYKPLSNTERMDWNNFLRFVNREKKVGGSAELDKKDKRLGLDLLEEFKQKNPDFSITPERIPHIQYEFQLLKNKNSLPDVTPSGRVKTLFQDWYTNRDVSPVDGWIGSLTSRQGYPEIEVFTEDPEKRYWGVDYGGASQFENSLASSGKRGNARTGR